MSLASLYNSIVEIRDIGRGLSSLYLGFGSCNTWQHGQKAKAASFGRGLYERPGGTVRAALGDEIWGRGQNFNSKLMVPYRGERIPSFLPLIKLYLEANFVRYNICVGGLSSQRFLLFPGRRICQRGKLIACHFHCLFLPVNWLEKCINTECNMSLKAKEHYAI